MFAGLWIFLNFGGLLILRNETNFYKSAANIGILPGGMPGATNLHEFTALGDLLKVHKGKIAAICAAPAVVLAPLGILQGKEATCYPGFEAECKASISSNPSARKINERCIILRFRFRYGGG